jgi:hypothetical protein
VHSFRFLILQEVVPKSVGSSLMLLLQLSSLLLSTNSYVKFMCLLIPLSSSSSPFLITGLLLNQWCISPLRLEISYCRTFLIMCDDRSPGAC